MIMPPFNWCVQRIHDRALGEAIRQYAHGLLLDVGCGEKPYQRLTEDLVTNHLGLDHPGTLHSRSEVDIFSVAERIGLSDNSVDTVLCTVVLEHLERPQRALNEMHRVLRPGGHLLLTAPFFWHLHEEPRDFYRYTTYGLEYLLKSAGFDVLFVKPLSGFAVTFGQELVYFLNRYRTGLVKYPVVALQWLIQVLAYAANRWDRSHQFSWAHLAVAQKRTG